MKWWLGWASGIWAQLRALRRVPFWQAVATQPFRKADESEQPRHPLDLFFIPAGPKDWKNPVVIQNITSHPEWPERRAGFPQQWVIPPTSLAPTSESGI